VIYVREWSGKKKGVGSTWGPWEPAVATLPDLSQMESQTYINEVDVRKIAVGQKVLITLDADPSKKLDGVVTQIANVGEQRPNQDSKVFEVKVSVTKPDTTLRPGMTTANAIEVASVPNVLSVPLEAVESEGGFSYIYKKKGNGVVRQMIEPGVTNDNEVVVKKGVEEDDRVYLMPPADKATVKTEVIPGLRPAQDSAPIDGKGVSMPLTRPPGAGAPPTSAKPKG
jgi:HlyD family secretion protein